MRNRYPGTCYKCGCLVPTGYGFFERVSPLEHGRRWRVQCVKCADGRTVSPGDAEVERARRLRDEAAGGSA